MNDEELLALIASRMPALYADKKNSNIKYEQLIPKRMMKTDWNSNPFYYGCYSYVPVGVHSTGTVYFRLYFLKC